MNNNHLSIFLENFSYEATKNQIEFFEAIDSFLLDFETPGIFILSGYAGTGKTSVISALVKSLPKYRKRSVLLAPTGRATKVLASYTQKKAITIHKKIYQFDLNTDSSPSIVLDENNHKNTLFIIDEASMIPADSNQTSNNVFGRRRLLDDLIQYVFNGYQCKILFVGDPAQLPPVGTSLSPALNKEYLSSTYSMDIASMSLTQVVRQQMESGILANATYIRKQIDKENITGKLFKVSSFTDIERISGLDLEDVMNNVYNSMSESNIAFITTSNKRANLINTEIRNRVLYREDEINAGDYLMITRNNYFWLPSGSGIGFLANGDILKINRIIKFYELYGSRFADCEFEIPMDDKNLVFDARINLDSIHSEGPSLGIEESKRLYNEVVNDHMLHGGYQSSPLGIRNDPWLQALQVKFAYAYTCHKTQGGQWDVVFVDQDYLTKERINIDYLRWLYTAVTRATQKVYLVNFHEDFFLE